MNQFTYITKKLFGFRLARTPMALLMFFCLLASANALELSPEQKQWILEHPQIRVANEMDWPPYDYAEKGEARGFSIDLLKLLAQRSGIKLEFVNGHSWDELLNLGKEKKIDVFPAIWKNAQRQNFLLFSPAYLPAHNAFIVRADDSRFHSIEDSKHISSLAIPKGFATITILRNSYPHIKIIEVENLHAAMKAVIYGQADSCIGNFGVMAHLQRKYMLSGLRFLGDAHLANSKTQDLHFAVRKDWPQLHAILSQSLRELPPEQLQLLKQKWLIIEQKSITRLKLTKQELKHLKNLPGLRLEKAKIARPLVDEFGKGLCFDILRAQLQSLQLKILAPEEESEENSPLKIRSVIASHYQIKDGEKLSAPYLQLPCIVLQRNESERKELTSIKDLKNSKLAVLRSQFPDEKNLPLQWPQMEVFFAKDMPQALDWLRKGKVDALIADSVSISYFQRQLARPEFAKSIFSGFYLQFSLVLPEEMHEIQPLLLRTWQHFPLEKKQAIIDGWVNSRVKDNFNASMIIALSALILILTTAFLYRLRQLSRQAVLREEMQKQLQQQIQQVEFARRQAELAGEGKSRFLESMSHEILTPLNILLGNTEQLKYKLQDSNLLPMLHGIEMAGRNLLNLIEDILQVARIERGELTLHKQACNISSLCEELKEVFELNAAKKEISFTLDLQTSLPAFINSDLHHLRQILFHLLGNACKFTEKGGFGLRVSCRKSIQKDLFNLTFEVHDSGQGLDPDHMLQLNRLFQQGDSSGGGIGMGITIASRLAHALGAQITVESAPKEGSRFCLNIKNVAEANEQAIARLMDEEQSVSSFPQTTENPTSNEETKDTQIAESPNDSFSSMKQEELMTFAQKNILLAQKSSAIDEMQNLADCCQALLHLQADEKLQQWQQQFSDGLSNFDLPLLEEKLLQLQPLLDALKSE